MNPDRAVLPLAQLRVPLVGLRDPASYLTTLAGGPLDAPGLLPAGSMWRMQYGTAPAMLGESVTVRGRS